MTGSRSGPLYVLRAAARVASSLAASTLTPVSTDQPRASARATCGSSGCVGGSLPVTLVQAKVISLRAMKAAAIAATALTTLVPRSTFLSVCLSAIALPPCRPDRYPRPRHHATGSWPACTRHLSTAAASSAGCLVPTSQYGPAAPSAGPEDATAR